MADDLVNQNLWTKEQREKITAWINSKWRPGTACTQCGIANWAIGPSPGHLILGSQNGNVLLGASYPVVSVICQNCGNMVLVNAFYPKVNATPALDIPKENSNG